MIVGQNTLGDGSSCGCERLSELPVALHFECRERPSDGVHMQAGIHWRGKAPFCSVPQPRCLDWQPDTLSGQLDLKKGCEFWSFDFGCKKVLWTQLGLALWLLLREKGSRLEAVRGLPCHVQFWHNLP
eukprot:2550506-Rhodomonas_salina.1